MRRSLLPLAVVMLPQVALAILQLGVPVLAPAFIGEAGLAPEAVGLVAGCIGLGSVWMFAANAAVTPVLGPMRALVWACLLALAGVAALLTGWVWLIFPAAIVIGFAYGVTAPAGSQILSAHTAREWRGTLFSIRMSGVPLGGALAGIIGTAVAVAYGWQAGLATLALVPLAAFALLSIAPKAYNDGVAPRRVRLSALADPRVLIEPFRTMRDMPQLRPTAVASVGFATVQGSLFSFFTTYMTDGLGLGLALAGTLYATMQVASVSGRLGAGLLADWVGGIPPVLKAMSLAGGAAMLVMAVVSADWPVWALFVVAAASGAAAATWNGLFLAEVAALSPEDEVGRATAGTTFFTFVAYMTAPPLFGGIAALAGYEAAFCMAAAAALGSFAVLMRKRG